MGPDSVALKGGPRLRMEMDGTCQTFESDKGILKGIHTTGTFNFFDLNPQALRL